MSIVAPNHTVLAPAAFRSRPGRWLRRAALVAAVAILALAGTAVWLRVELPAIIDGYTAAE